MECLLRVRDLTVRYRPEGEQDRPAVAGIDFEIASGEVLRQIPGLDSASLLVLHHHESFDGKGYPGRLQGQEIPIGFRIVSVIDAFDATVSSRPYRRGLPIEEAERRLLAASGTQFDPIITAKFCLSLARK